MRWHRDPLVHFLLLGAALFAANAFVRRGMRVDSTNRIVVGAVQVADLRTSWQRERGRQPTDAEFQRAIERFVREEIFFREALALGLAEDDSVVRQRLITKMEFLSAEPDEQVEPTDSQLEAYYNDNIERYASGPEVSFTHVYFDRDRRRETAWSDVRRALASLRGDPSASAAELGDPFQIKTDFELQPHAEVERVFGERFADDLFALKGEEWHGPLESEHGLHLVRVRERKEADAPQWDRIRPRVLKEWRAARRREADAAAYMRLRQKYDVMIEDGTSDAAGG